MTIAGFVTETYVIRCCLANFKVLYANKGMN